MLIAQVTPALLVFATLAQGAMSTIEEPRQAVVRTAAEWQALWKAHQPETPAPAVDFAQSLVVGVFLGSRPSAGFEVEIVAVKTEANRVVVEYVERRPPRDAFVAQILTSPFHVVRIMRTAASVEFRRLGP
jgi:PrcB C-terminal